MAATTKISRNDRVLNIVYIILIIVLAVLAIGGPILARRFEYVAGTRNDANYSVVYGFGLSIMLFLLTVFIACIASAIALTTLVLRHRNVRQILLKLALILLGPIICCSAFLFNGPLAPVFLKGFEQWVLQEVDIEAIQQWLTAEGAKHAGKRYYGKKDFPDELPGCLVELNSEFISFSDSISKDGPTVEITWFLFMDDYGLIVGPPEMETPEEGRIKLKKAYYEFRRPVKAGAYVFIRG